MKSSCKMFSAMKSNKLHGSLFKWGSPGISLTKVNFTPFSFTRHHNFYPKLNHTVLCTVLTSFHRNHPGFSGSFHAAVIWFYFVTPSIAGLMLWQWKASQLMQHSNVRATQTWEEPGKSCQGNQACERPNQKDHLEDILVCKWRCRGLCAKTSLLFLFLRERLGTCCPLCKRFLKRTQLLHIKFLHKLPAGTGLSQMLAGVSQCLSAKADQGCTRMQLNQKTTVDTEVWRAVRRKATSQGKERSGFWAGNVEGDEWRW